MPFQLYRGKPVEAVRISTRNRAELARHPGIRYTPGTRTAEPQFDVVVDGYRQGLEPGDWIIKTAVEGVYDFRYGRDLAGSDGRGTFEDSFERARWTDAARTKA